MLAALEDPIPLPLDIELDDLQTLGTGVSREAPRAVLRGLHKATPAPIRQRLISPAERRQIHAWRLLGASLAILVVTMLGSFFLRDEWVVVFGLLACACAAGCGLASGAAAVLSFSATGSAAFATVSNLFLTLFGVLVARSLLRAMAYAGFSRGRQIRRKGRLLLPRVEAVPTWSYLAIDASVPGPERAALAAEWRENGRTEHASVAAFARLTLDLMVLGAPAGLIAAANRDAIDEIRHTELCFSLARHLDGRKLGPGPFPAPGAGSSLSRVRALALARLAVDSLLDGALHEGVSARTIANLAKGCADPAITAVLKEIAADEGRHAAHGWEVVRWCLAAGGRPVAAALLGALSAVPERPGFTQPEGAEDGSWERWGIPGRELEAAEYSAMRASVEARVRALVLPGVLSADLAG